VSAESAETTDDLSRYLPENQMSYSDFNNTTTPNTIMQHIVGCY
jgi:hypothetical protein